MTFSIAAFDEATGDLGVAVATRALAGRTEAALSYDASLACTDNAAERVFLQRRQALPEA